MEIDRLLDDLVLIFGLNAEILTVVRHEAPYEQDKADALRHVILDQLGLMTGLLEGLAKDGVLVLDFDPRA